MFLTCMVIGLVGLLVMAVPAFAHHGAHGALPIKGAVAHAPVHHAGASPSATRFIPSPRLVFSVLALYGAFGNALVHALHLRPLFAALIAVVPALAVERFVVTPVWNLLFRFAARPSSPLAEIVLCEATAVTAFRNGRGIVSLVRDGRLVQFAAQLAASHVTRDVRVGDRLRVEDLDAQRERVTVVPED